MRKLILYIAFIALLFFISGCTQIMSSYVDDYNRDFDEKTLFDYNALPVCAEGTCTCFVCGVTNSVIYDFLQIKGHSFVGEMCRFESPCGSLHPDPIDKYRAIEASLDDTLMPFAIGMGTTFSDFSQADRYCLNKLNMPVTWLKATPNEFYPLPSASRSVCYLDRGLMPLYILYSGGKTADPLGALGVAQSLAGTGPVIITSEMDPNFDNPNPTEAQALRNNIAEQVKEMRFACSNCLIALAVKMGDTETLKLLEDQRVNDSVDLIAFGINSHNSKAGCSPLAKDEQASVLFSEASQFAKKILYDYNKSSVIAYMLFDTGFNAEGTCDWKEFQVAAAYDYFFTTALLDLVNSGVIGAAPYSYMGTSDPLNQCENCQIAKLDAQGNPDPNDITYERFENWFSFCQAYKARDGTRPTNDLIVVYPTQPGTYCSAADNNGQSFQLLAASAGEFGPEYTTPTLLDPQEEIFACDACVFDPDPGLSADIPFDFGSTINYDEKYCSGDSTEETAEIIRAIDEFSDLRGLDPMLVRALIWLESSFGKCSTSFVSMSGCVSDDGTFGNIYNLDNKDETPPVNLPQGVTEPKIKDDRTDGLACTIPTPPAGQKFCAYGLMQTVLYPGDVYRQVGSDYPSEFTQCAGEIGLTDDLGNLDPGKINPFIPEHSVCLGTLEFQRYYQYFENSFATTYTVQLGLDKGMRIDIEHNLGVDQLAEANKRNLLIAYFALHRYSKGGFYSTDWLAKQTILFSQQRDLAEDACEGNNPPSFCGEANIVPLGAQQSDCIGNDDFINYIGTCRIYNTDYPFHPERTDYGALVLGRYESLYEQCSLNNCPSYKKQQSLLVGSTPATDPLDPAPANP